LIDVCVIEKENEIWVDRRERVCICVLEKELGRKRDTEREMV